MIAVVCGFIWRMGQPVIMSKEELLVNGAVLLSTPRKFSDFELLDHNGDSFTLKNLNDQWSILFFAYFDSIVYGRSCTLWYVVFFCAFPF